MSQTITLCSRCGGASVPSGHSYYGKRCTCTQGGSVATLTDPSNTTSVGHKVCCKCGADVTHTKRMKDHLGRYWCYECGAADQLKRGSGLALKCPDCHKHFPPTKMLKHLEEYLCEDCHAERINHKGGSVGKLAKVLVVLVLVGVGLALLAVYALDLELLP